MMNNNESIKLVAMDLDGTLTQHKSGLEAPIRLVLDKLKERYQLVLVGAGSCQRIWEQTGRYAIDIIGNYGMQQARASSEVLQIVRDETVKCNQNDIMQKVSLLRDQLGYMDYVGETVEFHASGMITFPLLGTKAVLENKLAFDPTRIIRREMLSDVRQIFNEYTVFIGGTSSYDIAPPPYNKLYALDLYLKELGLSRENVIYAGDDYGKGGNDEHVYRSDIHFLCVDSYQEFPEIVDFLLK